MTHLQKKCPIERYLHRTLLPSFLNFFYVSGYTFSTNPAEVTTHMKLTLVSWSSHEAVQWFFSKHNISIKFREYLEYYYLFFFCWQKSWSSDLTAAEKPHRSWFEMGVWPNSRITPNFLEFKYPLFLSFYNSECSKKRAKIFKVCPNFLQFKYSLPFFCSGVKHWIIEETGNWEK